MNLVDSLRRVLRFQAMPVKHGFRRWVDGRVRCMCGWESESPYQKGIRQLHEHERLG